MLVPYRPLAFFSLVGFLCYILWVCPFGAFDLQWYTEVYVLLVSKSSPGIVQTLKGTGIEISFDTLDEYARTYAAAALEKEMKGFHGKGADENCQFFVFVSDR